MVIDANFTIVHDDLSEYLNTHDRLRLSKEMLRLEHGCISIYVDGNDSEFIIFIIDSNSPTEPIARISCNENQVEDKLSEICQMVLDYELALPDKSDFANEYSEYFRTIRDNCLQLRFIDGERKAEILSIINSNFINGSPRALWLSLKRPPAKLGSPERDPYWRLPDYISDERIVYFIIDIDNYQYAVYRGNMKDIHTFIGDCECLDEYYLMSIDENNLWCATDHDELLHTTV